LSFNALAHFRSFANWRKSRNAYRLSTGNPATGLMFHSGGGEPMDLDKLAQRIVRPAVEAITKQAADCRLGDR
jgi:hypothetical protein